MDAKLLALVRTYDGLHKATVQFDPPADDPMGRWRAWLMVINGPGHAMSVGMGQGYTAEEALDNLCQMRGIVTSEETE